MHSVPKELPAVFYNETNYDYHLITKGLTEEVKGQFNCLGENTKKYITLSVPIKKKLKIDKKLRRNYKKIYLTDYDLLTKQDLQQAHYQILLTILLKEFMKLNVQTVIYAILNTQTFRII